MALLAASERTEFQIPGARSFALATTSTPVWAALVLPATVAIRPWGIAEIVVVPKKSAISAALPPRSTLGWKYSLAASCSALISSFSLWNMPDSTNSPSAPIS